MNLSARIREYVAANPACYGEAISAGLGEDGRTVKHTAAKLAKAGLLTVTGGAGLRRRYSPGRAVSTRGLSPGERLARRAGAERARRAAKRLATPRPAKRPANQKPTAARMAVERPKIAASGRETSECDTGAWIAAGGHVERLAPFEYVPPARQPVGFRAW